MTGGVPARPGEGRRGLPRLRDLVPAQRREWDGSRLNRDGSESFRVRVGSWSVHARRVSGAGTGRPLVLVHGVVVAGRYMMPAARALAEHRPVYIPDLPGFGRSEGPRKPLDVHDLARSLAEWMSAAGLERADVIGHSFGCQTVSGLAARWPQRVGRLALLSPIGDPANRSLIAHVWRWMRDCPGEPLSVWGSYAGGFLRFGPRRALGTLNHSLRDEMEERLSRIQVPTLVVRGELDPIVDDSWAERVASLLPKGRLAIMRGAPHNVNYKTPRELTSVLLPFLEESATPGARGTLHAGPG